MSKDKLDGQCLCGEVSVEVTEPPKEVEACHCDTCRRWGSGPLFTLSCKDNVTFSGENNIQRYTSSEWAERAFCRVCGSHLFYFLKPTGQFMLSPGLFGRLDEHKLDLQVFVDEKPNYYCFAEETQCLTGEEVIALFNESSAPPN